MLGAGTGDVLNLWRKRKRNSSLGASQVACETQPQGKAAVRRAAFEKKVWFFKGHNIDEKFKD